MPRQLVILEGALAEYTVQRSRFIAETAAIADEDDAQAFLQAFHCGCFFAFALGSRLFVGFAGTQLGQQAGFFYGAFETAHSDFKGFVFFYTDCRHFISFNLNRNIRFEAV